MTEIYRPRVTDGYEWVVPDHPDTTELLVGLGPEPVGSSWSAPAVRRVIEDEGQTFEPADLPWLGSHALVLRARAREVLAPVLGDDVELLPLRSTDGVELWVTHALRVEPVLDVDGSELKRFASSGRIMRIVEHRFLPSVAAAGAAFRLAEMPRGALYVTAPVVAAAAAAGLTGAHFELVWSSDPT